MKETHDAELERRILREVYEFQKPRRFKYGLRFEHLCKRLRLRSDKCDALIRNIKNKGYIWILAPYRDKRYRYIFLTRRGRKQIEA